MKQIVKDILKEILIKTHEFIGLFTLFGCLIPNRYLPIFIATWPLIYLSWQLNYNRCILTDLEYYLDNKKFPPIIQDDYNYPFIRRMLKKINSKYADEKELSNKQFHYFMVSLATITWLLGLIRYLNYKKIIKLNQIKSN
jgi:hypothetical protein